MTEPKPRYVFHGTEFEEERLEISPNYWDWDAKKLQGKDAPIFIEVLDSDDEMASGQSLSISAERAREIAAALIEIADYLEAKND